MAGFVKCVDLLLGFNVLMVALFIFGPGMSMPSPMSLSPPSVCIAQPPVYQAIAKAQVHIIPLMLASGALAFVTRVDLALSGDEAITAMQPLARRFLRGSMVLALLMSAVTLGLGLLTWAYVLEVKVSVFSCLSLGLRFTFFSTYTVATALCTYVFGRLVWVVLFYD